MANAFDFELVADDKVSDVITRIDDAVRKLVPVLQNTKDELALGGQDTSDGLDGISDRLNGMSRAARDNVQFIGDMVPPLKMVGELSSKLAGVGALGAAGYGIKRVAESFADASREAYNLDVSAKNAGMRVDEFSRLSGAMQILGSDSQSANASIESMFKTFNDAASGSNAGALSAMAQIGAQIEKNQDGSVNVLKTLESIARVFPSLRPEQQKTAADALGLDDNGLQLLREGLRLKELLAKSDQFGLTVDPELNNKLADVNSTMNELGASWEGLKAKTKGIIFEGLLSDGSVKDGLEGITDLLSNGDFTGLSHALGFISSDNAKKLRRIQGDKELYDSLSRRERGAVDGGFYTDAVRKRYDARYGASDTAEQLQQDMAIVAPQQATQRNNVPGSEKVSSGSYAREGQYDDILREAGNKYNVDPTMLKAIMSQESRGNPNAISSADARGLMQVIPSNFKNTGVTDWRNPRQNIMAGAQIFAENLKRADGNVELALRYYNGGYDRRRWGQQNAAYPGAVLAHHQKIINSGNKVPSGNGINSGDKTLQTSPRSNALPDTSPVIQKVPYQQPDTSGSRQKTPAIQPVPPVVKEIVYRSDENNVKRQSEPRSYDEKIPDTPVDKDAADKPDVYKQGFYSQDNGGQSSVVRSSSEQVDGRKSEDKGSTNDSSIIQSGTRTSAAERENLVSAMKTAFEDQKMKLEITMVGRSGEKQTVETRNGGRISMPLAY